MPANTEIVLTIYFLAANALAAAAFWLDKHRAEQGGWRIPERTLLAIAFWGGSIGALCVQQLLRHKTRKEPFRSNLIMIALFHVAAVLALAVTPVRERLIEAIVGVL